jgi:hypothetical protein
VTETRATRTDSASRDRGLAEARYHDVRRGQDRVRQRDSRQGNGNRDAVAASPRRLTATFVCPERFGCMSTIRPAFVCGAGTCGLLSAVAALFAIGAATAAPTQATAPTAHPVHVRLVYTGGPFSPVSVVFTTTSRIPRVHGTDEQGPYVDAGVGVASNPSIRVSSYGRCYQGYASSYVVKHLHIGDHYPVTIAIGHAAAERRFTRQVTLKRATLKGTARQLHCH